MRKFTTLFLLAFAMTIGANQAFAAQSNAGGPNDTGRQESRNEPDNDPDNDGDDPFLAFERCPNDLRCPPRKPKKIVIKEKTDDCGCVHKVMRVNGRFMPFIDCYNKVLINGREQLRYCRKD